MSEKKVVTFADVEEFDDTVRAEVEAFGGVVNLASLNAELFTEYVKEREKPESEGRRNLILLCYSMMTEEQRSLPSADRIALAYKMATVFRKKSLDTVANLTKEALRINGLGEAQEQERKNV